MAISAGTRLGSYEILAPLGAGGMGEVCGAESSQHRHLYDVGPDYLVMEFVEGSPLHGPENTRRLLDIAAQIADGL